ncbi:uncharacterized protein LOC142341508 [Convolutriloba macropyga]|uniref:uncharacterized protein LOC142341508 n=1 Tax=Convolutriloba macropyga TaxID=536237 RepID=UPI003F527FB0
MAADSDGAELAQPSKKELQPEQRRLIVFSSFPRERPRVMRVHQTETTLPEVDKDACLKKRGVHKPDLFMDLAKECAGKGNWNARSRTSSLAGTPKKSGHGVDFREGSRSFANTSIARKSSLPHLMTAHSLERTNSRNLSSIGYFPENLEQVVSTYREKYKNKDWLDLDKSNSSISGKLADLESSSSGEFSHVIKQPVSRDLQPRDSVQSLPTRPKRDSSGRKPKIVAKNKSHFDSKTKQECHQAILNDDIHPNCKTCLHLLRMSLESARKVDNRPLMRRNSYGQKISKKQLSDSRGSKISSDTSGNKQTTILSSTRLANV